MTLEEIRMGLLWMVSLILATAVCMFALHVPVGMLGLPSWLSDGVTTVLGFGGGLALAGTGFSWSADRSQSLLQAATPLLMLSGLVALGTLAAVGAHYLLLPLKIAEDWHPIVVMFTGVGAFGLLVHGMIYFSEARERRRGVVPSHAQGES